MYQKPGFAESGTELLFKLRVLIVPVVVICGIFIKWML
jgi:hypothetical protein